MNPRPLVLDNSIVIAWALGEPSPQAESVIASLAHARAIVPSLWPLEVANALVTAERRGRISEGHLLQLRDLIAELPIEVAGQTTQRVLGDVLQLARAHGLSAYDAAYLELAIRCGGALASLDNRLAEAARAAGVAVVGAG